MVIEKIKNSKECPDFWQRLGMIGLKKYSRGQGVKLAIVDTCILETHNIFDPTGIIKDKPKCNVPNKAPIPEIAHGTAMASLIVGLPRKNLKPVNIGKTNAFNSVCGLANKAIIVAYDKTSNDGSTFWNLPLSKKKKDKKLFPSPAQPELHVMSWSLSSKSKGDWIIKLNRICASGGLLIAAAGNDSLDLDKKYNNLYPATIHLNETTCKYEPRIIVANQNQDEAIPTLNENSNYGSQYIHIAAPGTNIPQATPHFNNDNIQNTQSLLSQDTAYYDIASGTSPATAIVSATAALIMKCNRHISATELRNAIFSSATLYEPLKDKIENGRILCTRPAVEFVCLETETTPTNHLGTISEPLNDDL